MSKLTKITIFCAIILAAAGGFFIYGEKQEAKAANCYYPFQRIDLEEVYNGSVCQGNYQVYYFPVVTDGRHYTITMRTISGQQKLYASRYKRDVANISKIVNWRCYGPYCDSSIEANAETRFVTFQSPAGDPDYYSWFAVYGSAGGEYQIGLSNSGVFPFVSNSSNFAYNPNPPQNPLPPQNPPPQNNATSDGLPVVSWRTTTPGSNYNFYDIAWTSPSYIDSSWVGASLPDKIWNCEHCYREYRGAFYLDSVPSNLRMWFASDDGIRLYVNGQFAGSWGAKDANGNGCINNHGCLLRDDVGDISLTNLVKGKNVISALVINGGQGGYFDFKLKN